MTETSASQLKEALMDLTEFRRSKRLGEVLWPPSALVPLNRSCCPPCKWPWLGNTCIFISRYSQANKHVNSRYTYIISGIRGGGGGQEQEAAQSAMEPGDVGVLRVPLVKSFKKGYSPGLRLRVHRIRFEVAANRISRHIFTSYFKP